MLGICLALIDSEEDKEFFTEIYNKYHDLVMYIAMERLHNKFVAEESVQDTFLYVAKNFERIKNARNIKAYLCEAAKGIAINCYTKEKKYMDDISDDDLYFIEDVDDSFFDTVDVIDLKNAMQKLSEEDRTFLELAYAYNMQSKDIAELYGLKDTNVRKKIERSKKKLRNLL